MILEVFLDTLTKTIHNTGIYKFKKGFNGDFVEFVGELNMVFKPATNKAFENAMKIRTKLLNVKLRKQEKK